MFTGNFQTPADDIGPGILTGTITGLTVRDMTENLPAGEKTWILETDDAFSVEIDWQLAGPMVWVVGGYWHVSLYLDDIGVGSSSGQLAAPPPIPMPPTTSDPMQYSFTFNLAGNSVTEGVYHLTVVINHSADGNPAHFTEMAGFAESGPLQFTVMTAESN